MISSPEPDSFPKYFEEEQYRNATKYDKDALERLNNTFSNKIMPTINMSWRIEIPNINAPEETIRENM